MLLLCPSSALSISSSSDSNDPGSFRGVSMIRKNESPDSPPFRSRARKGKHGPKKQPQRGLGVAQLEKLRLEEQSKQEAACIASLHQHHRLSSSPLPADGSLVQFAEQHPRQKHQRQSIVPFCM
eukprot:c51315_g1_i1 orf=3-371(-)